jgi:hypothetical protein
MMLLGVEMRDIESELVAAGVAMALFPLVEP